MAYDDNIPLPQGSPKLSEIALDRPQPVIEMPIHAPALVVVEQLRKVATDALTRVNYILHSDGQIRWDGEKLFFDSDAQINSAIFKLLQTEESVPRHFSFYLKGSLTGNGETKFRDIEIANKELIYLEIDRAELFNNPSGEVDVENAVGGGSLVSGRTLKRVSLAGSGGMPPLSSPLTGSTLTLSVPLCLRWDWTDGIDTYQDLWWIPHGIRWPKNVVSTLGAVIAKGLEAYPDFFVRTAGELTTALNTVTGRGGVVCIVDQISIDSQITIPAGVTLLGRTGAHDPANRSSIVLLTGGQLRMEARSRIKDLAIYHSPTFTGSSSMVVASGGSSIIENCAFVLSSTTGTNYGVWVSSNDNTIKNNYFNTGADRIGVRFESGDRNILSDNQVTSPTHAHSYASAINPNFTGEIDGALLRRAVRSSPPPGTIMAIIPGHFISSVNSGYTFRLGTANSVAAFQTWLNNNGYENWRICNGAAYNDPNSPIYNGAGRNLPNLTDGRFLRGEAAAGTPGGALTVNLQHKHTMSGSTAAASVSWTSTVQSCTFTQPTVRRHYHSPSAATTSYPAPPADRRLRTTSYGAHRHSEGYASDTSGPSGLPSWGRSGTTHPDWRYDLAGQDRGGNPWTSTAGNHSHYMLAGTYVGPFGHIDAVNGDSDVSTVNGAASFNKNVMNTNQNNHSHAFGTLTMDNQLSTDLNIEPRYINCFYIQCVK